MRLAGVPAWGWTDARQRNRAPAVRFLMTAAPKICPNKKRKFFIWASFHNESLVAHYLGVRARGVVILLISSGLVLSHTRSQKAFVYNKSKETTIGPCDGAWSAQSSRCSDARRRGRCSARPSTQWRSFSPPRSGSRCSAAPRITHPTLTLCELCREVLGRSKAPNSAGIRGIERCNDKTCT